MKQIYCRPIVIGLLFFASLATNAQNAKTNFANNVVKVQGTSDGYGFITYSNKKTNTAYLIIIKRQGEFSTNITVLLNKARKSATNVKVGAHLVTAPFNVEGFQIGLYQVSQYINTGTKYFSSAITSSTVYAVYGDVNQGDGNNFEIAKNIRKIVLSNIDEGELGGKLIFSSSTTYNSILSGTPVIDENGLLKALIAERQREGADYVSAIDIIAIRRALANFGKRANDECKYFNIVEQGSPNDETPCETTERQVKEKAIADEAAKKAHIEALHQEELVKVFNEYSRGSKDPEIRRIYHKHQDRVLAISIGGSGNFNYADVSSSSGSKSPANGVGYTVGPNIYINPDKGHVRLILKPRYAVTHMNIGDDYSYSPSSTFKLSTIAIKTWELPLQLDIVTARKEKTDRFIGIGFGVAKHNSSRITYTTAGLKQAEEVPRKVIYSEFATLEMGESKGRIRYSIFARYQVNDYLKKDYEVILNNEAVLPFRDVSKRYWLLGVEFQLRLWNRWLNDYRTMF